MVLVEEVWLICLDLLEQCPSHFHLFGMNCVLQRKYSYLSNEKNTIRNEGSTALYAAYTFDTV